MIKSHLEISFRSIRCFTDDGKLDAKEFHELVEIALRDGKIDDDEKRVLNNIISKIHEDEMTPGLKAELNKLEEAMNA